ncbi:MFS transporter [Streptomyces sp. NBC_01390]|uniref:MFS transporter n=1 Tax=Streptomyces sp. NBC_01390 TaxID=2903850 RepID=UPI00325304D0
MTITPDSERHATYREVLADPRFRLLFVTRTLTVTADSLRIMTLSVLVFTTTGSPLLGALTFGVGFLPQLAGSLFLGSLADRVRPRPLVVAGHVLSCATAAAAGLVVLPVPVLLLLFAAVACLTPVFSGVSVRLVAETLTGDAYVLGRSLSNMSASGAQLLGLAGGGVAIVSLGPRNSLLLSSAAYLIAAVAVRVRLPDLPAPGKAARPGPGASVLRHSWSESGALLTDRTVRTLLLAQWLPAAFVAGAESLVVPFTGGRSMSPGSTGTLLACLPVGMLAGDLVVGRFLSPAARERLVPALVVVLGAPLLVFAVDPPWLVCAVLLLITGAGFAYGLGLQRPFLDAVPETARGQAFGLLSAGMMSSQGLGPVAFGTIAEFTDAGTAMALSGLATLGIAVQLTRRRRQASDVRGAGPG